MRITTAIATLFCSRDYEFNHQCCIDTHVHIHTMYRTHVWHIHGKLSVYKHVCMYLWMHVRMYIYVCVYDYVLPSCWPPSRTFCMVSSAGWTTHKYNTHCVYTHAVTHTHRPTFIRIWRCIKGACVFVRMYTHIFVNIYMFVYSLHIHAHLYHAHVYACMYVSTHTAYWPSTYAHTYIHTCTFSRFGPALTNGTCPERR